MITRTARISARISYLLAIAIVLAAVLLVRLVAELQPDSPPSHHAVADPIWVTPVGAAATVSVPVGGGLMPLQELRDLFDTAEDHLTKREAAIALTHNIIDTEDGDYINYLVDRASIAVSSTMPAFLPVEGVGGEMEIPQSFADWCASNSVAITDALRLAMYEYPQDVHALASTFDARASDTLELGLESSNYLVVTAAARGLGVLRNTDSITSIVEAAGSAESIHHRFEIASNLLYYDLPSARATASAIITDTTTFNEYDEWISIQIQTDP